MPRAGRLALDVRDGPDPTLVLVHGFGCNRHHWDPVAEALAGQFRIVTLDLPGHGESAPLAQATIEELARAVVVIKNCFGGEGIVFGGHSLGCRVVLKALRMSPAKVLGVVLLEQNLITENDVEGAVRKMEANLDAVGIHEFMRSMFEQMFSPRCNPEFRKSTLAGIQRLDPDVGRALLLDAVRWEGTEAAQLGPLSVWGVGLLAAQSTWFDYPNLTWQPLKPGMSTPWLARVNAQVPDAGIRYLSGGSHFSLVESAEEVATDIAGFAGALREKVRRA
jgi:pimeloyl-ACP methyl ester carboxylesterase